MSRYTSGIIIYSLHGRRPETIQVIKGMKRKVEKENILNSHSLLTKRSRKLETFSSNIMIFYNWMKEIYK